MRNRHPDFSLLLVLVGILCTRACPANAETFTISTVAGNGQTGDLAAAGPALSVPLDQPFGVEAGPDGGLFITSVGQHRVLRLDPKSGVLSSVAGNGAKGHSGDGALATAAQLNEPYEVRFDSAGNMLFVEMQNHLIRRVDAKTGNISTIAGAPQGGFAGDGGPAVAARFKQPHSIALDRHDNIYIADIGNHRIRKIDARSGTITTIAGNGEKRLPAPGPTAGKPMVGPRALAIVGDTMWIALREGHSVWKLDLVTGLLSPVAGAGKPGYSGDGGPPREATFNGPKGIAATADGLLYVVDTENQAIRLIDTKADRITTIAGGGPKTRGYGGDGGPALKAQLDRPHGVGLFQGAILIGDTNNHRVRRLAQ